MKVEDKPNLARWVGEFSWGNKSVTQEEIGLSYLLAHLHPKWALIPFRMPCLLKVCLVEGKLLSPRELIPSPLTLCQARCQDLPEVGTITYRQGHEAAVTSPQFSQLVQHGAGIKTQVVQHLSLRS